jgi:hypothetical protein
MIARFPAPSFAALPVFERCERQRASAAVAPGAVSTARPSWGAGRSAQVAAMMDQNVLFGIVLAVAICLCVAVFAMVDS